MTSVPEPSYAQARRIRAVIAEDADGLEPSGKNIPMVCLVPGRPDIAALEQAVRLLVQRHTALQYRFTEDGDGSPSLEYVGAGLLRCDTADMAAIVADDADAEAADSAVLAHVRTEVDRPFDALGWPLLRVGVVLGDTSVCYVSGDHLITDGWSQALVMLELPVLYEAVLAGRDHRLPPAADFLTFADAQRRRFRAGPSLEVPSAALRRALAGRPLHPPFALDVPWDETASRHAHRRLLDADEVRALHLWCRERRVTLFMAVLAAFGTALREVAGTDRAGVLIATHNRDDEGVRTGVGWYANMLPLYFPVTGDLTGTARDVRRALMTTLEFHELPLARVAGLMAPEQARDDHPSCFLSLTDERTAIGADGPALATVESAPESSWRRIPVPPTRRRGYGLWISLLDQGLTLATASPAVRDGDRSLDALETAFAATLRRMCPAAE